MRCERAVFHYLWHSWIYYHPWPTGEHRVEQLSDQSAGKAAAAEPAEEQVPPQAETARLTAMQELSKVYTAQHGDAPSAEQLVRDRAL